ncbi:MAG: glycosyltransferase family 4 protein [Patescibacteria group bacterium]
MKIIMIGQKGMPSKFGGVETHVSEISTRLVRAGHTVIAYARNWYTPKGTTKFNGVQIVRLPSLHTKVADAISHTFLAAVHALIFVRPDVYHFHGVGPSLLAWMPRVFAPKATVITTFHSVDRYHAKWGKFAQFVLKLGERAALTFAHTTIAVSKTITDYSLAEYGLQSVYIPNGITPQRVATDPILLAPFGLEPYGYVVMVSRLVAHKGAHTLIAAWKLAKSQTPELFRSLKLAIVGGSAFTDKYVSDLKAQAAQDSSVVLTGYQAGETLEALFAGARFAVHPSVNEGLPIAVLEEMSYGKAVIAADIPENREIVDDYGVIFKAGDVEDLAAKITELVKDPMQAAGLGHVARTFVEESFNWDDIATDILDVYRARTVIPDGVLALE